MNVILWNSSTDLGAAFRPAGSHVIASWLRENGYTVKVIDFCSFLNTDELVAITRKYITDSTVAIGISTTFWEKINPGNKIEGGFYNIEPTWVLKARECLSEFKGDWILGGSSGTALYTSLPWVRFINESEDSLLKHLDGRMSFFKLRNQFSIITQNSDYNDLDFIHPAESLPIELSRGCMFKCKFCGYENIGKKKGTYIRSKESIKRQLLENYYKHGTTIYSFADDTVNESFEKMKDLADIAQSLPFELKWGGFLRADLLYSHKGSLSIIKDSGFKTAYFGIESFHPHAAKTIGKGWNGTSQCKSFLADLAKDDSISLHLAFIIGLPEETKEDIYNTYDWCKDNGMNTLSFHGLGLSRDSKRFNSYFSRNYSEHGYSFPYDDNYEWKNDIMTNSEAMEISNDITNQQWIKNNIASFNASLAAGPCEFLNIKYDDIFKYKNDLFLTDAWKEANKKLIERYVKAHNL